MINMEEPENIKEEKPFGIQAHMFLTSKGIVIDQGPAWFWRSFLEFADRFGYFDATNKKSIEYSKNAVPIGKVYEILKSLNTFTKTWTFKKVVSYIRINKFTEAPLLDQEASHGQYFCDIDLLFSGCHNDLENEAFCVLRVPFVIVVNPRTIPEYISIFKTDMLNSPVIIKSPMTFLIEQNYPQEIPDE